MKKLVLTALVAVFLYPLSVNATSCNGHSCDNVPGHECEQGVHTYNPHCNSPSPTERSTDEKTPKPTNSPQATATASATPSATPQESVLPTPQPTNVPDHQNTSDGRSDGRGCATHDCSIHEAGQSAGMVLSSNIELPSTGSTLDYLRIVAIGLLMLLLGMLCHKIAQWMEGNNV